MPIYHIKCNNCDWECDVLCKYEALEITACDVCGCSTSLVPSRSGFVVKGFNADNGYSIEEFRYDGVQKSWD